MSCQISVVIGEYDLVWTAQDNVSGQCNRVIAEFYPFIHSTLPISQRMHMNFTMIKCFKIQICTFKVKATLSKSVLFLGIHSTVTKIVFFFPSLKKNWRLNTAKIENKIKTVTLDVNLWLVMLNSPCHFQKPNWSYEPVSFWAILCFPHWRRLKKKQEISLQNICTICGTFSWATILILCMFVLI